LFKDDYDYMPTYREMAVVENYFRDCYAKRQAKLGEKARWFGHGGTIFPNVSYSNGVQSMGTWHPSGPHQTETWRIFLAPKAAPDEVKAVLRHYVIRYQGPAGLTEQDDMENWGSSHQGARGTIARRSKRAGRRTGWEARFMRPRMSRSRTSAPTSPAGPPTWTAPPPPTVSTRQPMRPRPPNRCRRTGNNCSTNCC